MPSDRPTDPDASPFPPPPALPESLLSQARGAPTEPAPDDSTAAILGKLDLILDRLGLLERRVEAVDKGVGVAIGIATDAAGTAAQLLQVAKDTASGVITLRSDFEEYRDHAMKQWNRDGERREAQMDEIRQSVTDIQEGRASVGGE